MATTTTNKYEIKSKVQMMIENHQRANPHTAIAWVGWQAPGERDVCGVNFYMDGCWMGAHPRENPKVWDDGNEPTIATAIIGNMDGKDLHAIILTDKGNYTPYLMKTVGDVFGARLGEVSRPVSRWHETN